MRRAAALLLVCASCGETPVQTFPGLVTVSGAAPWNASSCAGPSNGGTFSPDAEVEPAVAVDPKDPKHFIGIWQQDRWSNGGSNGLVTAATFDGGHSWTAASAKLTRCTSGRFDRASDPWVSIGPDGAGWQIGFGFDATVPNRAMLVSRSDDGGRTWGAPSTLQFDTASDVVMDKETLTADPLDGNYVYAVWDRLTGANIANNPQGTGPTWFARTTNRGSSWEPAQVIYDPGADAQTIGNLIVVLPDGTLVDVMMVLTQNSDPQNTQVRVAVARSTDRGATAPWPGGAITVNTAEFVGVVDPKSGRGIRTGNVVPTAAVDPASGAIYVAWEDARFSSHTRDGIALSRSIDGGLSWSTPVQVNSAAPGSQAFTPALAVGAGGALGVTYYDLRNDDPQDASRLLATQWLAVSTDGGASFSESAIGAPFNIRAAPLVDGPAYFLGDYQGLAHAGAVFLPFFAAVPAGGNANIYFRPADAATAQAGPLRLAVEGAQQLWRGARERWRFGTLFK
jgi:hypothetical protein